MNLYWLIILVIHNVHVLYRVWSLLVPETLDLWFFLFLFFMSSKQKWGSTHAGVHGSNSAKSYANVYAHVATKDHVYVHDLCCNRKACCCPGAIPSSGAILMWVACWGHVHVCHACCYKNWLKPMGQTAILVSMDYTLEAMLMFMVHAAAKGHDGFHGLCCGRMSCCCLWSVLPLEIILRAMLLTDASIHSSYCYQKP